MEVSYCFCVSSAVEKPPTDWSVMVFKVVMVSGLAKSKIGKGATGSCSPSRLRAAEQYKSAQHSANDHRPKLNLPSPLTVSFSPSAVTPPFSLWMPFTP